MAKVIAIANQKGGVGKTTTALALSAGLMIMKTPNVLLIDADPQGNSSDTYQAVINDTATLYDLLVEGDSVNKVIQKASIGDIIPSDPLLCDSEKLINGTGREYKLKEALEAISNSYEYIIIDTPPTLGILLINALTAADSVIVPVTADRYGLQGLAQLQGTIQDVKKYTNPTLDLAGLLMIKYNNRTNLNKEVAQSLPEIAYGLNTVVFDTKIRESIAAREAQAARLSLYYHAPNSTTANDYRDFINEADEKGVI